MVWFDVMNVIWFVLYDLYLYWRSLSSTYLGQYVEKLKVKHGKNDAENSLHSLQMPDDEWIDNV